MAQPFVPKGYLCVDDAIAALRDGQESIADARLRLRTALRAGAVRAVIQDRKTGVLRTDDPHHWAGANGDNHLNDNGEVYLHGRQFAAGVWCDFLIVEKTIREFLDAAVGAKEDTPTRAPDPLPDTMPQTPKAARLSVSGKKRIFAEWRESRKDNLPTIEEDVAEMRKRHINRADTRELRRDYENNPRGKRRGQIGGGLIGRVVK